MTPLKNRRFPPGKWRSPQGIEVEVTDDSVTVTVPSSYPVEFARVHGEWVAECSVSRVCGRGPTKELARANLKSRLENEFAEALTPPHPIPAMGYQEADPSKDPIRLDDTAGLDSIRIPTGSAKS